MLLQWFMTEDEVEARFTACKSVAVRRAMNVRPITDYCFSSAPKKVRPKEIVFRP